MEFTDRHRSESHTAYATAVISGAETMQDITTRWKGGKYETIGITFQPQRVRFSWRWDDDTFGWYLSSLIVSGPTVLKDSSHGLRHRSVEFVRQGVLVPITPSELIALASELAPTSGITQS